MGTKLGPQSKRGLYISHNLSSLKGAINEISRGVFGYNGEDTRSSTIAHMT